VEAVIRDLSGALARLDGVEVHVVATRRDLDAPVARDRDGVRHRWLPEPRRFGNVTRYARVRRTLRAALADLAPDVVHAHGTGHYALAALDAPLPSIVTVHGILWKEARLHSGLAARVRERAITGMEREVLRRARHVFVIARYVGEAIAPWTRAELHPVANPVAADLFDRPAGEAGLDVVCVATIRRRKGQRFLVEAFARVRGDHPAARLHLVGPVVEPDYAESVRDAVRAHGLDDAVTLHGGVSDAELRERLASCAVFALPSLEESSPVSIAEAMTLGKPVVATRVGGVPDLVEDGATGRVVPAGDPGALAAALGEILADPGTRRRMGERARERARREFHPDAAARRAVEVYRRILSSAQGGPG
jgi:glycosyltransferase involved in cell wall biosynthesis